MLSNLKAYVRVRAGEVGEVPRPFEFKGQVANDMMDPGDQVAWRTWDCVNEPVTAYARRYAGWTSSTRQTDQLYATLEEAREALGDSFMLRSVKLTVEGGVLQWQTRQGGWIPVDSPPSGDCQRYTSVAPPGGATGTSSAPTGADLRPWGGGGGQATQPPCSRTSPTVGLERLASMSPVRRMKGPSYRGVPVPRPSTVHGFARWHPTWHERACLPSQRHWQTSSRSGHAWGRPRSPSEASRRPSAALRICNGSHRQSPLFTKGSQRAASAGPQPYLVPAGLVLLVDTASKPRYELLFGALATLALVCFPRVGEVANRTSRV